MDKNPFAQTTKVQDDQSSRRRSTRIDYVTTVLLSGKDASGTPFREFTQTLIVNLHGCKVRTSYRIIVGMLVTVECPKAGTSGKGVCVRVWDPPPGVAGHEIAVQLIKPQNLWGVPNPPPDWELCAKTMVQGRGIQTETPTPVPAPVAAPRPRTQVTLPRVPAVSPAPTPAPTPVVPPAAAPVRPTPVAVARPPAVPSAVAPVAPPVMAPVAPPAVAPVAPPVVAPVRPAPVVGPTIEQRLADLERRATQLVDSVLDIMRGQAEELTRDCLEEFRQQVDALIQDAEVRMRQGLQQAYEESAASLIGLRTDLMEQMASRSSQMIRTTEDTLRTRLRGQLSVEQKSAPQKLSEKVTEK
jgi:hypothetical protein